MPDEKNKLTNNDDLDAETMNLEDNCGKDMNLVTDGQFLQDGIVEVVDKKEYIDEP